MDKETIKRQIILLFIMLNIRQTTEKIPLDGTCSPLEKLSIKDIGKLVLEKCVLVATPPIEGNLLATLQKMSCIFSSENNVFIGIFDRDVSNNEKAEGGMQENLKWNFKGNGSKDLAFFKKLVADLACLLPMPKQSPDAFTIPGERTIPNLVHFLNENCGTYVSEHGGKTVAGHRRESILTNIYHVPINGRSYPEVDVGKFNLKPAGVKCEETSIPTKEKFIKEFLFRSKPVIIKQGIKHWKAISKWTNEYLQLTYGNRDTHIKLTPKGEYEGCDYADKFENYKTFVIPDIVKSKLPYPELVVVRPATMNMQFSQFIELIEGQRNLSAYLEYTSIPSNFKELEEDVIEPEFIRNILEKQDLNIWLSDGNTLGKLHFDPFDNLLCQLKGTKEAILFEPHNNTNLYEAHIQEAKLWYNEKTDIFHNHKLVDSTSMVMSPVDILKPDYSKFPNFRYARPINCTISEGDILYLPAFWWHEIQSYPDSTQKRNLALNYWYKPFLTKLFPCPTCKLDVNGMYRHLLEKY